ncbi:hypothetical protein DFQ28_009365 [Apophysomyces sp. BC1034]|nr:hypothetical protein DFQ30_009069 [Apophysomyces sp. BC1015]KAG0173150.1 hypothetical protein DFQ29_008059 [Apophysomyces sp. BC1021]KAG0185434.1 hypothetical protein DFQ28_009365 [Apophysomyces sp. BC1034]
MSPLLESQDEQGSLGVDSNLSLLTSPKNNPLSHESPGSSSKEHNEEVMDLFLNQVAEYNARQLGFDDKLDETESINPSHLLANHKQPAKLKVESTSQNLAQLTMNDLNDAHLMNFPSSMQQPQAPSLIEAPEKADVASSSRKRSAAKAKNTDSTSSGSSLLNVFTNPLLHAIPILARNCLNFEDFLAQTALSGQNGMLGPKDEKQDTAYASPNKLILDPSRDKSIMTKIESPWRIRVLGLPTTGAKSRVETQIKVCVQLVNTSGELANNWSHLRLPDYMVAKDKLKRKQQKYVSDEKTSLIDSEVLNLEAAVVCDSHADNEIIMCTSCVHRERKRLKRKRDNKVARAANKEGGAAKVASLCAIDLPDLDDENVMAQERRKILLFNCNEYVEFHGGEATLPTRVTCYCRHHSEKVGFRIVFTLKDSHNHVIATGRSPPIMITDDHKSSKVQTGARKRPRTEFDSSRVDVESPATSRRKASNTISVNNDGETDSGVSSPVTSAPATPSSQADEIPESSPGPAKPCGEDDSTYEDQVSTSTSLAMNSSHVDGHTSGPSVENFLSHLQQHQPGATVPFNMTPHMPQGELFNFLNSDDMHMVQLMSQQDMAPSTSSQQQVEQHQQPLPLVHPDQHHQQILTQFQNNPMQSVVHRRRLMTGMTCAPQQWQTGNNIYAKMQQKQAVEGAKTTNLPRLHRLIPSEGPIYGGAEVTVLGSNFYEGLTCLFGENPAVPTHCWSTNTLLCILPPAANAGPVVVSFKEHPLMLEGQDVVLFTYFDESDRALMELALQVVGLKTMGKVEDARQIAMRIVQGDNGERKSHNSSTTFTGNFRLEYRNYLTYKAAEAAYYNARMLCLGQLEEQVTAALVAVSKMGTKYRGDISLTNRNRHSLLHLATMCGYVRLVRALVKLGCNVDQTDRNGFTALHFASWTGKEEIVRVLIGIANVEVKNLMGKTAEKLAIEAGHNGVVALFQRNRKIKRAHKSQHATDDPVRTPLIEFIPSSAVTSATTYLPTKLTNMLSSLYTFSTNQPCVKQLTHSVGQVYNFMLDPF